MAKNRNSTTTTHAMIRIVASSLRAKSAGMRIQLSGGGSAGNTTRAHRERKVLRGVRTTALDIGKTPRLMWGKCGGITAPGRRVPDLARVRDRRFPASAHPPDRRHEPTPLGRYPNSLAMPCGGPRRPLLRSRRHEFEARVDSTTDSIDVDKAGVRQLLLANARARISPVRRHFGPLFPSVRPRIMIARRRQGLTLFKSLRLAAPTILSAFVLTGCGAAPAPGPERMPASGRTSSSSSATTSGPTRSPPWATRTSARRTSTGWCVEGTVFTRAYCMGSMQGAVCVPRARCS